MKLFPSPIIIDPKLSINVLIDDFVDTLNKGILKHNKKYSEMIGDIFPINPDEYEFYVIGKGMDEMWVDFFANPQFEVNVRIFITYVHAAHHGLRVFPDRKDVFRAFRTNPRDVKVVIIGQDPYPGVMNNGDPVAMGLSFATRDKKMPASLRRMFKAIENKYGQSMSSQTDFTLKGWIDQGVMLLNYNLFFFYGDKTEKPTEARDLPIWNGFMDHIITKIIDENPNAIFLLMGGFAQKLKRVINNNSVEAPHPSPMSRQEFTGDCFLEINSILEKKKITKIDWTQNI